MLLRANSSTWSYLPLLPHPCVDFYRVPYCSVQFPLAPLGSACVAAGASECMSREGKVPSPIPHDLGLEAIQQAPTDHWDTMHEALWGPRSAAGSKAAGNPSMGVGFFWWAADGPGGRGNTSGCPSEPDEPDEPDSSPGAPPPTYRIPWHPIPSHPPSRVDRPSSSPTPRASEEPRRLLDERAYAMVPNIDYVHDDRPSRPPVLPRPRPSPHDSRARRSGPVRVPRGRDEAGGGSGDWEWLPQGRPKFPPPLTTETRCSWKHSPASGLSP